MKGRYSKGSEEVVIVLAQLEYSSFEEPVEVVLGVGIFVGVKIFYVLHEDHPVDVRKVEGLDEGVDGGVDDNGQVYVEDKLLLGTREEVGQNQC